MLQPIMERFFSVADSARILGMCDATIFRAIHRGELPAVMPLGRRIGWRIKKADLARFTAERFNIDLDELLVQFEAEGKHTIKETADSGGRP